MIAKSRFRVIYFENLNFVESTARFALNIQTKQLHSKEQILR